MTLDLWLMEKVKTVFTYAAHFWDSIFFVPHNRNPTQKIRNRRNNDQAVRSVDTSSATFDLHQARLAPAWRWT